MSRVLIIFIILTIPFRVFSQVILTEVMFDPATSDKTDEFVEIFNLSGRDTIDLTGWRVGDGTGDDFIIDAGEGLKLLPGQYCVILDGDYMNLSNTYDNLIPESALVVKIDGTTIGSGGLSNSRSEVVTLYNDSGIVVASYAYSTGNISGHSDEKINLFAGDEPENWGDSRVMYGTPGFCNSIAVLKHDLMISSMWIDPSRPRRGDEVVISGEIINCGSDQAENFSIAFFRDIDEDSCMDDGEEIESLYMDYLSSGDSLIVDVHWQVQSSGVQIIGIVVNFEDDMRPENNLLLEQICVGFKKMAVVINEIMYDPLEDEPEWIEIYNTGVDDINISGWAISDSDTADKRFFIDTKLKIPHGGYAVISEDSSILDRFPYLKNSLYVLNGFPNLRDSEDWVVLYDPAEWVIDRVEYRNSWGGGDGFSLERINPLLSSSDSSNWGSSVSVEGSTPGAENTIFTSVVAKKATIYASPNPFSPDDDGHDDVTIISYNLPMKTSMVNLLIFDIRGRHIRGLMSASPSGSKGSVIWDGRDDEGRQVPMGIYLIFIEGLNSMGGVVVSAKTTVVVAGKL